MWTHGKDGLVARHASRQKLEHKYFYENQDELMELARASAETHMLAIVSVAVPSEPRRGDVERIGIEVLRPRHRRVSLNVGRKARDRGHDRAGARCACA